jgi:AbrB family looped-hinge helix DNA binding protein
MAVHLKISANGRVCIPADVRARLGLKDGDTLLLEEQEDGLVLLTAEHRVRRAQDRIRKALNGRTGPTVDEFLEYKREQARLEEAKYQRLYGPE